MKVLLVDDDRDLLQLLPYALRREGHEVVTAADGPEALRRWRAERPDVVLLDIRLPELDGFEVCRRIRESPDTPIIMLTGLGGELDVVRGLQLGADDFVTKPASIGQLEARIEAVVRRARHAAVYEHGAPEGPAVRAGDLTLNPETREASSGERTARLTPTELHILRVLATNAGQVVPYARSTALPGIPGAR